MALLGLFDSDKRFDSRYILSVGERARKWGMELYNHLIQRGKKVETEVKD
jgi:predicted transcriptional regulator